MIIDSIRAVERPNVHAPRPVLVMTLDLGELAGTRGCDHPALVTRLVEILPGLALREDPDDRSARRSEDMEIDRLIALVAAELATRAGSAPSFCRTRAGAHGTQREVIVECTARHALEHLLRAAVDLVTRLLASDEVDVEAWVAEARRIAARTELGPSTRAIVDAATARGIPWIRIGEESLIQLGHGRNRKLVAATISSQTSALGVDIACDKQQTRIVLDRASIPVPTGCVVHGLEEALSAFESLGPPVVLKPLDGQQGKGVSTNLATRDEVAEAFSIAREHGREVIVERFIKGRDYRIICVDGRFVAAAERLAAHVTGDGAHTVRELIEVENRNPQRGDGHEKPLTRICVDETLELHIARQRMTLESVPADGQMVSLRPCANLSKGGIALDVTDEVHASVRAMCERVARIAGLDICGIDFVTQNIAEPLRKETGAVVEINAAPGIRMHHHPWRGTPRDVGGAIVDMLFPAGSTARIPIVSITGTNGKTTVTRMVRHVLTTIGRTVGMTSTDGIWIGEHQVAAGDMSGPHSAECVLADPAVDVAVLETARGGILRSGLGYDWADVAVVTNVRPDHIGQDGITSVEDLVAIKALVAERVHRGGCLVVNADDEGAMSMLDLPQISRAAHDVVLFTLSMNRPCVRSHVALGGRVLGLREGWIVEIEGQQLRWVMPVAAIPVTLGGAADFHVANALAAAAACRSLGASRDAIARALATFAAGHDNPGRTQLFRVRNGYVMVDYGHNPDAFAAIGRMTAQWHGRRITGVIGVPGDRCDRIILEAGAITARHFDRLIVKEDHDGRGRGPGEVALLLYRAIRDERPDRECVVIHDECEALLRAVEEMRRDEVVVIFYDKYEPVIDLLLRCNATPVGCIEQVSLGIENES